MRTSLTCKKCMYSNVNYLFGYCMSFVNLLIPFIILVISLKQFLYLFPDSLTCSVINKVLSIWSDNVSSKDLMNLLLDLMPCAHYSDKQFMQPTCWGRQVLIYIHINLISQLFCIIHRLNLIVKSLLETCCTQSVPEKQQQASATFTSLDIIIPSVDEYRG